MEPPNLPKALALKFDSGDHPKALPLINVQEDESVLDHLCDNTGRFSSLGLMDGSGYPEAQALRDVQDESEPDVDLLDIQGTWVPDLSLSFPPTFSDQVRIEFGLFSSNEKLFLWIFRILFLE